MTKLQILANQIQSDVQNLDELSTSEDYERLLTKVEKWYEEAFAPTKTYKFWLKSHNEAPDFEILIDAKDEDDAVRKIQEDYDLDEREIRENMREINLVEWAELHGEYYDDEDSSLL